MPYVVACGCRTWHSALMSHGSISCCCCCCCEFVVTPLEGEGRRNCSLLYKYVSQRNKWPSLDTHARPTSAALLLPTMIVQTAPMSKSSWHATSISHEQKPKKVSRICRWSRVAAVMLDHAFWKHMTVVAGNGNRRDSKFASKSAAWLTGAPRTTSTKLQAEPASLFVHDGSSCSPCRQAVVAGCCG